MTAAEARARLRKVAVRPGEHGPVLPVPLVDRLIMYFTVYASRANGEGYGDLSHDDARTFLLILAELIEV